jgi:hypothetical protein
MSRLMYALYGRGDQGVRASGIKIGRAVTKRFRVVADAMRPAIVIDEQRSAAPLQENGAGCRGATTGRSADCPREPTGQLTLELFKAAGAARRRPLGALVGGDRVVDPLVRASNEATHGGPTVARDLSDLVVLVAGRAQKATSRRRGGSWCSTPTASSNSPFACTVSQVSGDNEAGSRLSSQSSDGPGCRRREPRSSIQTSRCATRTSHAFQLRSRSGWCTRNCTHANVQASSMFWSEVRTTLPTLLRSSSLKLRKSSVSSPRCACCRPCSISGGTAAEAGARAKNFREAHFSGGIRRGSAACSVLEALLFALAQPLVERLLAKAAVAPKLRTTSRRLPTRRPRFRNSR